MRKSILVLLLFAVALPFQAQSPYLVKDINTTVSFDTSSSFPTGFTSYRNRTYFVAATATTGTELWSSGGNGASLVADIIPGNSGSNPAGLKVVNDVLLFTARDVDHGVELWATDGTAPGTRRLLDINPGPSSSQPATAKFTFGNRMFFSADDGTNGRELWVSDGTTAGTRMVMDLNPGATGSFPSAFVPLGNSVYFVAAGGLWKTDGTQAGTVKVSSVPARFLTVAGGKLFFEGTTGSTNWEPWVSDGTEAGTRMVADIIPGTKGSLTTIYATSHFTPLGNLVLFLANDDVHGRELWISDGTAAGTRLVRDLLPGAAGMWDENFFYIGALGNRAWFAARDAEHGEELWVTDGTEGGTVLFADLVPGHGSVGPWMFAAANGKLFVANSSLLWVTDGSIGGTRVIGGVAALGIGSVPDIAAIDGQLFFPGHTMLHGTEPWVTDGTDAGTRLLANLASDDAPSSKPFMLTATKDLLFFYAIEGTSTVNRNEASLWRSDGTAGGTWKLRDAGPHARELTAVGPYVFSPESFYGPEMLMSDGTIEGTKEADDFLARFGAIHSISLFPFGDTLFASVTPENGRDAVLWKTTAAPNAAAEELGARNPYGFIEVAGHYAFYAPTGSIHDRSLWTTEGTRAGTRAIVPDLHADYQGVSRLVNAAGTIYFLKAERDQGAKLWKSDGTLDGTTAVVELPGLIMHRAVIAAAGRKVFIGEGDHFWASDGTEAGTVELTAPEIPIPFDNTIFKTAGDRVFFLAPDQTAGYELWSSDGTQSGTVKVGRSFSPLTSIEGLVYFAGSDEQHGMEVWTTDGTVAGTKLLIDLNPGPASSEPDGFVKLGDTIYFSAYTDATGKELWALPLTEPRLSIADARAPEGDAAPAVVRFTVTLAGAPLQAITVDYATANETAIAGQDYEAASGTLTFLPGETTKFVDVRVTGDASAENNEMFIVRLSNANGGARLVKGEATGIIDDQDQMADLSVALSLTTDGSSLYDAVNVSNLGPRAATEISLKVTTTPSYGAQRCETCLIPQLAVGESTVTGGDYWTPYEQVYLSAIATARQDDPETSNNNATWTVNAYRTMVMSPAWLTPGATGTITARSTLPTASVTSSDRSVVVPSAVTKVDEETVTFTVTAVKPGTSRIYLDQQQRSIDVTVVASDQTPRWPGALSVTTGPTATRFHDPVTVTITPEGVAPVTAATPTGTVAITSAGHELAFLTIGGTTPISFPLYLPALGANKLEITYSGDPNFLPQTFNNSSVFVRQGDVSITGTLVRVAGTEGTYTLAMEAAGSPLAAPTGTVAVFNGTTQLATISLQPSSGGISRAEATLTNLPVNSTLTLNYAGDSLYRSASQQIRAAEARRRSVRH